ncbi:MAG: hypothetical protein Q9208_005290 [Pyrenodesmia sp. 3 TL-2023]
MSKPGICNSGGLSDGKVMEAFSSTRSATRSTTNFAYLIPFNHAAKLGFHQLVEHIAKDKHPYRHSIHFMRQIKKEPYRAYSPDSEDEGSDAPLEELWTGVFALSFQNSKKNQWEAGNEWNKGYTGRHELLLTPPTKEWQKQGICGRHFVAKFDTKIVEMVLTALHTVKMGSKSLKCQRHAIHHGDTIAVGAAIYQWEYTAYTKTPEYNQDYKDFRRPRELGSRLCPDEAFRPFSVEKIDHRGVTQGYSEETTTAVSIQRVPQPEEASISKLQKYMNSTGGNDYFIQVVDVVNLYDPEKSGFYRILKPLVIGSLARFAVNYEFNVTAIAMLLHDWATGLAYIHEELEGVHCNVTPLNLGFTEVQEPGGVILDDSLLVWEKNIFDAPENVDQCKAPEVILLKAPQLAAGAEKKPYGQPADVFSLGLNIASIINQVGFRGWYTFATATEHEHYEALGVEGSWVTESRWKKFDQKLDMAIKNAKDENSKSLIAICRQMVAWDPAQRLTARRVAELAVRLVRKLPERSGALTMKSTRG